MKRLLSLLAISLVLAACATHTPSKPTAPLAVSQADTQGVQIITAVYGSGTAFSDVTARVSQLLQREEHFYANPEWLDADPTPGWNKALVIVFRYRNAKHIFTTGENGEASYAILQQSARK